MVIGKSGLGKSSFIDYFLEKNYSNGQDQQQQQQEKIQHGNFRIKQGFKAFNQTTLNVNIIDAPGYDIGQDVKKWYDRVRDFIAHKVKRL